MPNGPIGRRRKSAGGPPPPWPAGRFSPPADWAIWQFFNYGALPRAVRTGAAPGRPGRAFPWPVGRAFLGPTRPGLLWRRVGLAWPAAIRQGVARQPGGRAHPRWAAPSVGGLRGRPGEIKVPKTPQRPRPTVGRPLKRSENYRHTDIQTYRHTDKQANGQTDKQANRQTGKQTSRQAGRQTCRQTGKQANRQANMQTNRQTGKQTCMLVHTCVCMSVCLYVCTYIHTDIQTYRHTYVRTYVRMYVCLYVCMYVHTYVSHIVSFAGLINASRCFCAVVAGRQVHPSWGALVGASGNAAARGARPPARERRPPPQQRPHTTLQGSPAPHPPRRLVRPDARFLVRARSSLWQTVPPSPGRFPGTLLCADIEVNER